MSSDSELMCSCSANVPVKENSSDSWHLPTEGHVVVPYLPPVPPSGTGIHRFVFTLYTHTRPLETMPIRSDTVSENWLQQRKFSTSQFLADNMAADKGMRPFTFSYFQTYWDTSVRHVFKHVLSTLVGEVQVCSLDRRTYLSSGKVVRRRVCQICPAFLFCCLLCRWQVIADLYEC